MSEEQDQVPLAPNPALTRTVSVESLDGGRMTAEEVAEARLGTISPALGSSAGIINPVVSFEVRPRDFYIYYVTLERPGDLVKWSFYTKKKNIAFGLYYLHALKTAMASGEEATNHLEARGSEDIHKIIEDSRSLASIWPPPKNATNVVSSGAGASLSRSNSQLSRNVVGGTSDGSLASTSASHLLQPPTNQQQQQQHHQNLSTNSLASQASANIESSFHANQEDFFAATAAFPLGQGSSSPEDQSHHPFEFIEIMPSEKYESYETTINGSYKVPLAGVYAFCFDNTFSINTSKQVFLSLKVIPSTLLADHGVANPAIASAEIGSLGVQDDQILMSSWMMKRRRKAIQGYAKRWVQLERNGVLNYYASRNGPSRGSIDVKRSAISRVPNRRIITIDSSDTTFHLKALSSEDFDLWTNAINTFLPTGGLANSDSLLNSGTELPGTTIILAEKDVVELARIESEVNSKIESANSAIAGLRELVNSTDDGSLVKYVGPLEQAFGKLDDLFKELSAYSGHLKVLRRSSQPLLSAPCGMEEEEVFYDVEISESDGEDEWADAFEEHPSTSQQLLPSISRMSLDSVIGLPPSDISRIEFQYRTSLPAPAPPITINMASFMMKSIGKDFSSMIMPMVFNEPIGALQKLAEELEYADLLDKAANETDSLERLVQIVAFAVSGYANNQHRAERKPFNPILGETYEYQDTTKQIRFISEKVSHKPLVMACHASGGSGWELWQDLKLKPKFWGKSIESVPSGALNVKFADNGDHFQWSKVVSCLRNAYGGNKRIENYGDVTITNLRTGDVASLTFKTSGGFFGGSSSANPNEVIGVVRSADGSRKFKISGRWDDLLMREMSDGQIVVIWKANPLPPLAHEYYGFSSFTLRLNQLLPGHTETIPPTDTRLRPDQRLLEEARVPEAEAEQLRLIERSRQVRAQLEAQGQEWKPRWFSLVDGKWQFNGDYWQVKETKSWSGLPELW